MPVRCSLTRGIWDRSTETERLCDRGIHHLPSTTLRPRNKAGFVPAGFFPNRPSQPLHVGKVAFVSPSVEVRGTPPACWRPRNE